LAGQIAFQTAEALDEMLENFPPDLLKKIRAHNEDWVFRALHRKKHLNALEAALKL
jgi:hypothetical protein